MKRPALSFHLTADFHAKAWIVAALFAMSAQAQAADVPQSFTLDGQLFADTAATSPLLDASIAMKIQILDENGVCVLYEESQNVNTVFTKGYFTVQVGSSTGDVKRGGYDTGNAMNVVFQNINNVTGKKAADGTACTVTATGGQRRYVRVTISPASMGGSPRVLSPDLSIDSVPNAVIAERAETLQGYRSSDMLKVNTTSGTVLSQSNLESLFTSTTRFNALSSIVDGTSSSYVKANTTAGAQLPVFATAPSAPTAGSVWYDSSDQKMKYRTGANTTEILNTGSGGVGGSGTTGRFPYFSGATTLSDSSMYYNTTNIGIGGDPGTTNKFVVTSSSATGTVAVFDDNASSRASGTLVKIDSDGPDDDGYFLLKVSNQNTAKDHFVVRGDGFVGIGTNDPYAMLHLQSNSASGVNQWFRATSGAAASAIYFNGYNAGTVDEALWSVGLNAVTTDADFSIDNALVSGGASFIIKRSDGRIGMNIDAPAAALDITRSGTTDSAIIVPRAGNFTGTAVNGMIRYNSTSNLFEFRQNGAWANYTTVSDGRLKTNIEPVTDGLKLVNKLNPVFYDWDKTNPRTASFGDRHEVGFIAQEVEKVLPEVVTKGADGYRSLEYGKVVSVVVAAVQELSHKVLGIEDHQKDLEVEVERLKAENAARDRTIHELEERLERLEARRQY